MIDTAEKRRTVVGLSLGWGITPEVLKDVAWRRQVAWSYGAILIDAVGAKRRRSVAGIFFLLGPEGVTPNVLKDQEWRQQAGYGYSGILAGAPDSGVVVTVSPFGLLRRRRRREDEFIP